ncbi:MAG: hypothetical protein ACRD1S_09330 [Vicinamibacterales bacterium]
MKSLAFVGLVAVLLVPGSAGAQGLAEAAKRAGDARKTGTTRVLTDGDLTDDPGAAERQISAHALTQQNFQAFMNTRRAYVKLLLADAPLRGRMQARMVQAKSVDSAVAVWNAEERVLALIRENGTNPREFLLTELAVAQAAIVLKAMQETGPADGLPPTVERNVAFVKAHWLEIESFAREIQALASQMP